MKSFSALTLLSAFVLALTALSSNHNNCNGQQLIQGVRINQRREDTAAPGTTASTAEENGPDIFIPRSYLRRTHSRRMNLIKIRNTALRRRGLLDGLLPSLQAPAGKPSFFLLSFFILFFGSCLCHIVPPPPQRSVGSSPNSSRFPIRLHALAGIPFPNCITPIQFCR